MSNETKAKATDSESEAAIGMSLRDWFAGQALAGLLANPSVTERGGVMNFNDGAKRNVPLDQAAYIFADAMLATRGGAK